MARPLVDFHFVDHESLGIVLSLWLKQNVATHYIYKSNVCNQVGTYGSDGWFFTLSSVLLVFCFYIVYIVLIDVYCFYIVYIVMLLIVMIDVYIVMLIVYPKFVGFDPSGVSFVWAELDSSIYLGLMNPPSRLHRFPFHLVESRPGHYRGRGGGDGGFLRFLRSRSMFMFDPPHPEDSSRMMHHNG